MVFNGSVRVRGVVGVCMGCQCVTCFTKTIKKGMSIPSASDLPKIKTKGKSAQRGVTLPHWLLYTCINRQRGVETGNVTSFPLKYW